MKINFAQDLIGLDSGKPIQRIKDFRKDEAGNVLLDPANNPIPDTFENITLGSVCIEALLANKPNENVSGPEKVSRFMLAASIRKAKGPIDLTVEDVAKIKELLGTFMTTLVCGAASLLLEKSSGK